MKCLLVDDEPGIREGLAALLRRKGHDVRTAGDCATAAAALGEQSFDVVITDWRLPDGQAMQFVVDCPFPVVAVSGHPEEVEQHAIVRTVLGKPVAPSRLLEALATARSEPSPSLHSELPIDVRAVLDAADACLLPGATSVVEDDGTFVVWRAPVPDDFAAERLDAIGGDPRVFGPPGALRAELRLCRDGRPDPSMPSCGPEVAWPDDAEFAVDFHGTGLSRERFAACLDRILDRTRRGQRVHLLNVPPAFAAMASDWGKANDMPMKEPVGPRLPAVLVDLWKEP